MKSRVFLPSILSGVLLWCCFYPLNWWPLAFVALVPYLTLVRAEGIGPWRRYTAAWLGGLVFAALAMKWMRVAHPMMALAAWPAASVYISLYWPAALLLLRRLDRLGNPPLALTVPLVWVALEFVRAHFPTGFAFMKPLGLFQHSGLAWYFLGHTQHENLPLLQVADLGGVYLISAAVASLNGALHDWAVRLHFFRWFVNWPRGWRMPVFRSEMMNLSGAMTLLVVLLFYGGYRLLHKPFEVGPRVSLLQESVGQNDKMNNQSSLFTLYAGRSEAAAAKSPKPDLIIWPETCFPYPDITLGKPEDLSTLRDEEYQLDYLLQEGRLDPRRLNQDVLNQPDMARVKALYELGRKRYASTFWRTNVLLGLSAVEWDGTTQHKYNSARLIYPDGSPGPRYDKMNLVPLGEFVPFRSTFPWIQKLTPYEHDYHCTAGDRLTRFSIETKKPNQDEPKTYRFGVVICYEDSDPSIARQYNNWANTGEPVDFLVNISNDGWFDGTEEHEQHLALARFRAVETRRTVVRAVNMGISVVIDPDGRIRELPNFLEDGLAASKKVAATVTADIPLDTRGTVYAALGDWLPKLCWLVLFCLFANQWLRRRLLVRRTGTQ